jgi:SPP1 family predicted phage head-tail adaptor
MKRGGLDRARCVELHSRTGVTTSQDGYGQPPETYSKYATAYIQFMPMSGKEFLQAQQVSAQISGKAKMRYDSRVSAKDRIIYNGRTLEVVVPINVGERNEELEIWYNEIL